MSIQVSYEGLYEKAVTFKNAAVSPAAAGKPVKISENDTVCLCAAGDKPAGVCLEADGKFALVQVSGCVTLPYTGATAFVAGYNTLAVDGAGGVKVVTTGGKEYLVFKVDATAKTLCVMM